MRLRKVRISQIFTSAFEGNLPKLIQKQQLDMFYIKAFLKISATFTRKYICWSLFFKKLQARWSVALLKRDFNTGVFCKDCEVFKNTYFEEHLPTAASDNFVMKTNDQLLQVNIQK